MNLDYITPLWESPDAPTVWRDQGETPVSFLSEVWIAFQELKPALHLSGTGALVANTKL